MLANPQSRVLSSLHLPSQAADMARSSPAGRPRLMARLKARPSVRPAASVSNSSRPVSGRWSWPGLKLDWREVAAMESDALKSHKG